MNRIMKGSIIIFAYILLCSCATTSTANLQGVAERIDTAQIDCSTGTGQHDISSKSNSEEGAPPPATEELGNMFKSIKEFFIDDGGIDYVFGFITGWF